MRAKLAADIMEAGRAMYARGLICAKEGNISARLGPDRLLVTPSGMRKHALVAEDLVECDLDGAPIPGSNRKPSSELRMHLAIYRARPDVHAIVHAHPPVTLAHTVAGLPLDLPLMPETYVELGEVPVLPYTTPTTEEVPEAVRAAISDRVALIMDRHGSITVGRDVAEAYDRLEVLEQAARVSWMARSLRPGSDLEGLAADRLASLRVAFGGP